MQQTQHKQGIGIKMHSSHADWARWMMKTEDVARDHRVALLQCSRSLCHTPQIAVATSTVDAAFQNLKVHLVRPIPQHHLRLQGDGASLGRQPAQYMYQKGTTCGLKSI